MILRTENIVKVYHQRTVVDHVNIEVQQGEIVGLLGPNGAGKTTSFYIIVGLIKALEGKVFLDDMDITKLPMYKRAKLGVGYLAQEASVFRQMSVENNIASILEFTEKDPAVRKQRLETLLVEFGIDHVRKTKGISLSGGERRRTLRRHRPLGHRGHQENRAPAQAEEYRHPDYRPQRPGNLVDYRPILFIIQRQNPQVRQLARSGQRPRSPREIPGSRFRTQRNPIKAPATNSISLQTVPKRT